MKIVAIDSSGLTASIAVVEDDILLAEYTIQYKKTHSQTLLPMMEAITKMIELDLDTIDAIAVAAGPGSFTGLRIGSATAKGMGLALKKPLIAVPTLDALAYNLYGTNQLICPIMDARRGQVYTGIYEFCTTSIQELHVIEPQCAVSIEDIIAKLNMMQRETIFVGDGIPVYADILGRDVTVPFSLAPAHRNRQSAASLAVLAQQYYREGKTETAEAHQPIYLRLSQAERERLEAGHDSH
ncbi:MAG: tRNA (adenosine(37)-N6)-threonylcarbamoyltransferase complex dimerization subunit type 1 TsaB [Lachnospiraceae bacterium]